MTGGGSVIAGPVIEEKVGDLSRKYADTTSETTSEDSDLESTRYGRSYLRIRRECVITPVTVRPTGHTQLC
jgi:hypothetical protein